MAKKSTRRSSDDGGLTGVLGLLFALLLIAGIKACAADPAGAERAAQDFGFTQAHVTSTHYVWPAINGCSEKDMVGYDMTALNSAGQPVELITCNGMFKAFTVRVAR